MSLFLNKIVIVIYECCLGCFEVIESLKLFKYGKLFVMGFVVFFEFGVVVNFIVIFLKI